MGMDLIDIPGGLATAKTAFDTLRAALGMVKDVQGVLPAGEKKDAVARTLEEAGKQVQLAEAQIAQALGYPLCTCVFPPPVMLKVGHRRKILGEGQGFVEVAVHECPRCRQNDALGRGFSRQIAAPGALPDAPGSGA